MTKKFEMVSNRSPRKEKASLEFLNIDEAKKAASFHESFPEYEKTPLVELKETAELIGVKDIFVKDESYRFGLNAFKVIGGSYAIGNYLAEKLGTSIDKLPYEKMISAEIKEKLGDITFITATDGNHGRGVAWTANRLKQKSVVLMPDGSSLERLENIKNEGADAWITKFNYDDSVREAKRLAEENGWVMVQDTAWEEYKKIPTWIIQGYSTMAYEAYTQLKEKPTHIFVQAGVGSLASAVTGFFAKQYGAEKPKFIVVEPEKADCIFITAKAADGRIHNVTGKMDTIMAGLACGEPCTVGWEVLDSYVDYFISCHDEIAANGMRILGKPVGKDQQIISGESGAVTMGCVFEIMKNPELAEIRKELELNQDSVVLCFSTEGDTDKESYRNIVWGTGL